MEKGCFTLVFTVRTSGIESWYQNMTNFLFNFMIQYFNCLFGAVLIGYVADLIFGDPHSIWHPVCFIGTMISVFEKGLRRLFPKTEQGEFTGGICLVILVLICSAGIPMVILMAGYGIHWILGFALQSYMCYTIFATKSLKTESMKVYDALNKEGLEAGRKAVSMIVGRDTERLDEAGVTKAAVETIAENTSDGIIAPMIFMVIGGPVLGYFYKGVNTMDSMVGYKNEKYMHFGTAAAKFDDFMNYLPSRISALLMVLAACLLPGEVMLSGKKEADEKKVFPKQTVPGKHLYIMDGRRAYMIWKRDRRNHASPNSAQTESVMAGALGVQLAGDAWYFGKQHEKPTIGDALRPIGLEDIPRANRLLYATSAVGLVIFLAIRFGFVFFLVYGMIQDMIF